MKKPPRRRWRISIAAALLSLGSTPTAIAVPEAKHWSTGDRYAVATVQPLATDAAFEVFRDGGNAVDAAIAAALTLSVVDNHNSGIGGGCLALVRTPSGEFIAIDGRETAPAASHRDMYLVDGVANPELSRAGPLAVATPGALAAYQRLLDECGTLPLSRLLAPGMKAARDGFSIDSNYAKRLKNNLEKIAACDAAASVLLRADGTPHEEGDLLRQPDLAATYRAIAEQGPGWFYRGPFAERVGAWMEANGGVLRATDFAAYEAKRREPIVSSYRGRTIIGFPPPSSGGVHVAQILNTLASLDMAEAFERDDHGVHASHLLIEAMKLAFADRAHWLGDADFVDVPRGLASQAYADSLATRIDPDHATTVASHGTPPQWRQDLFGRHTTHIAAADADGWWVTITATVNTGFGSGVIVPGTGVVLNNEMDDFSAQPGAPNAFGLVGAENNAVQPGKRPLSSMSPTLVLGADGEPLLAVGAAGGPKIITQVVLAIVRVIDQGLPIEQAVAAPRVHHQWRPDEARLERANPLELAGGLGARGHAVVTLSSGGVTQAVARDADGRLICVHDPRVPGKAAAE